MDVLQCISCRRIHLMAWQLQLAEQQRATRLLREYLTAYYSSPVSAVPWQQDTIEMYNPINSEISKLVPHVIIIRESSL